MPLAWPDLRGFRAVCFELGVPFFVSWGVLCASLYVQDFFLPLVKLHPGKCAEEPLVRAERPLLGGKGGKAGKGAALGWRSKHFAAAAADTFCPP